ncbi:MAG: Hsp20/alpha crystallin family protein [Acidobacteriota bacterium]
MPQIPKNTDHDLALLRERIGRLFDSTLTRAGTPAWEESPEWSPLVDMYETDTEVVLVAEVPGLTMDALDVQVTDASVTLKGERGPLAADTEVVAHRLERAHGAFSRTFHLNTSIDREQVTAEYKLGLVKVVLPKRGHSRPKSIQVSTS